MSDTTANLGDELFGTPMGEAGIGEARANREVVRAAKPGDLIPPTRTEDPILENGDATGIPDQEEFYRSPARFGSVPVDQAPLGWDRRLKFNKLYPFVSLPTQVVERVSFGNSGLEPKRLFWGDNLHVMRQLPSESIDLIYIDPPFFSGRQYNVIFGDQNEMRSFGDMWDGGLPGYLEWLNARLFEMKRLLKPTGSIYVHLDWHAVHYVKTEMDKTFGYDMLINEVIRLYAGGGQSKRTFARKHDTILWYAKSANWYSDMDSVRRPYDSNYTATVFSSPDSRTSEPRVYTPDPRGKVPEDWVLANRPYGEELIGYPTQKPETLIATLVHAASPSNGVVADFFIGGGTTAAVAQRLGRRWIACDQSRVAVAVTADRLAKQAEQSQLQNMTGGGGVLQISLSNTGAPTKRPASLKRRLTSFAASLSMRPNSAPNPKRLPYMRSRASFPSGSVCPIAAIA